jgi:hypothetical protein
MAQAVGEFGEVALEVGEVEHGETGPLARRYSGPRVG